jgi:hypothetical protein
VKCKPFTTFVDTEAENLAKDSHDGTVAGLCCDRILHTEDVALIHPFPWFDLPEGPSPAIKLCPNILGNFGDNHDQLTQRIDEYTVQELI